MVSILSVVPQVINLLRNDTDLKTILGDNDSNNPKIIPEEDNVLNRDIFPVVTFEETQNTPTYFANNEPIEFQIIYTIRIYTANQVEVTDDSNLEDIEKIKSTVDAAMQNGTFVLTSTEGGPIYNDGDRSQNKRLYELSMTYELLDVQYFISKYT